MNMLFLGTAAAGVIYILTPGPGMIALFTTVASSGRRHGVRYLAGELIGDVVWSSLGLAAVLGLSAIGPTLFGLLGVACGTYLTFLGWKALTYRLDDDGSSIGGARPFRTGLVLGFTNPKSYPVFVTLFAAVIARYGANTSWSVAPGLIASAVGGFLLADVLQIGIAGLPTVRRAFLRHRRLISRFVGMVFVAFGVRLTYDSVRDLTARA